MAFFISAGKSAVRIFFCKINIQAKRFSASIDFLDNPLSRLYTKIETTLTFHLFQTGNEKT